MPLLARLGYRVWAPDLRGYGESARPPRVQDYAIETLMDDVGGLIDAAAARSTLLLAHDWGGVIAWYFAMRRLRPLDRLVVMNLPHPAIMERDLRSWRQLRRSWYVLFFQIPRLPEALLRGTDYRAVREAFRTAACRQEPLPATTCCRCTATTPHAPAHSRRCSTTIAPSCAAAASRQRALGYPVIDIPTLLLWGEEDVALGKETTYGTERYVRNLTVRYLPGRVALGPAGGAGDGERDAGGVAHRSAGARGGGSASGSPAFSVAGAASASAPPAVPLAGRDVSPDAVVQRVLFPFGSF